MADSFHSLPASEVASRLECDPEAGLAFEEARRRLRGTGLNAVDREGDPPLWKVALRQFRSIVVLLLLAASIVAWLLDEPLSSIAILAALLINAVIGFLSEWRAMVSLANLRALAAPHALVRRGSRVERIDSETLVPGDIVLLDAGDSVPADLRLVRSISLRIIESALTGESMPADKDAAASIPPEAPLAERHTMAWMGTTVAAGTAEGIVTATGARTELGRIGGLVKAAGTRISPLERQVEQLGRRLMLAALVICGLVGVAGILHGEPIGLMIETALSLAVAAVPEGLPAVTTLALAAGLWRLARAGALVRRLPAVETLGCTTVICVDKTGTLTENRMRATRFWSEGRFLDSSASPAGGAGPLLEGALLASAASFSRPETIEAARQGRPVPGDPAEAALLMAALDRGMEPHRSPAERVRVAEIPFDPATRFMATLMSDLSSGATLHVKGAPEVLLARSSRWRLADGESPLDDAGRAAIEEANQTMAEEGLRVLAVAKRSLDGPLDPLPPLPSLVSGLTHIGLVGMIDPPRAGVREALQLCDQAGIRAIMLTGDQHRTAVAIGRQLGLPHDAVRSRVSPEEKLALVRELQAAGEIVAMTGDGVNDTPALARADIGIAMGKGGTDAARETADLVLTDDNFSTIVRAVEQGRVIDANLRKVIRFLFSCNLSEILTIFAAILLGYPAPLLPLQILWVNLVTDILPALALVRDPTEPGIMRRPARLQGEALLTWRSGRRMVVEGGLLAAGALSAYLWTVAAEGGPGRKATTMAFMALVLIHPLQAASCRSVRVPWWRLPANPLIGLSLVALVAIQALTVAWTPLSDLLGTSPLTAEDWLVVAVSIVWPVALIELWKEKGGAT